MTAIKKAFPICNRAASNKQERVVFLWRAEDSWYFQTGKFSCSPFHFSTTFKAEIGGMLYRKKWYSCSKILDSLTAWLGEKRKTEFSWTPASQAVSESVNFWAGPWKPAVFQRDPRPQIIQNYTWKKLNQSCHTFIASRITFSSITQFSAMI